MKFSLATRAGWFRTAVDAVGDPKLESSAVSLAHLRQKRCTVTRKSLELEFDGPPRVIFDPEAGVGMLETGHLLCAHGNIGTGVSANGGFRYAPPELKAVAVHQLVARTHHKKAWDAITASGKDPVVGHRDRDKRNNAATNICVGRKRPRQKSKPAGRAVGKAIIATDPNGEEHHCTSERHVQRVSGLTLNRVRNHMKDPTDKTTGMLDGWTLRKDDAESADAAGPKKKKRKTMKPTKRPVGGAKNVTSRPGEPIVVTDSAGTEREFPSKIEVKRVFKIHTRDIDSYLGTGKIKDGHKFAYKHPDFFTRASAIKLVQEPAYQHLGRVLPYNPKFPTITAYSCGKIATESYKHRLPYEGTTRARNTATSKRTVKIRVAGKATEVPVGLIIAQGLELEAKAGSGSDKMEE